MVAIVVTTVFNLGRIGQYLVFESKPSNKVDALVVLSGGSGNRIELAAKLYKEGVSARFIINGEKKFLWKPMTSFLADYAERLGVNKSDIVELNNARSTYENAVTTLGYVQKHNLKTICIVTSTFHTRRSYRVFKNVFKDSDVMIYSAGADDGIDYKNWWKDYEMVSTVLQEWSKTLVYWFLY